MHTHTLPEKRGLLPNPITSDLEHDRFYHLDIVRMTPCEMWAEHVLLTEALARRIFDKAPDRFVGIGGEALTERQWLTERLERLSERQPRRKGRAA